MEIYGDESGHLRSLRDGNCPIFVLGVVAGPDPDCTYCASRAVRHEGNLDEAKWNEMEQVTKRRFVDCLVEHAPEIELGYVAIRKTDLDRLDDHHLLYRDEAGLRDWDLYLMAFGYAEILASFGIEDTRHQRFRFDRFSGADQSDTIAEVLDREYSRMQIVHDPSHRRKGIQTADCFAGAVSDSLCGDAQWLQELPTGNIVTPSDFALARLEQYLATESTGP